jgi:PiT family inorganic phosphate transporter
MSLLVIVAVIIALLFNFLNGMNLAACAIATIVFTKVLSPFMLSWHRVYSQADEE